MMALRTKRTAGADCDGRRDRLQDRDPGLDAAAIYEHGLHRFRNAVALILGPYFAITPTIRPPITGVTITHRPR